MRIETFKQFIEHVVGKVEFKNTIMEQVRFEANS